MVARRHLDGFISPVTDAEGEPLQRALGAIDGREQLTVADLGCGSGALLPFLLARFDRVVAVDVSAEMLARARDRVRRTLGCIPADLELHRRSLTGLRGFARRFDVAVTANSLLMIDPRAIRRALRAIHRSLAPRGVLLGVFPALESVADAHRFAYEQELRAGLDHGAARRALDRKLAASRVDFALGVVDNGHMLAKHYGHYELTRYLSEAGFESARLQRLVYRRDIRYPGTEQYRGRPPRAWHWLAQARLRR